MTSSIVFMMSDLLWIGGMSVFPLVWVMDTSPFPVRVTWVANLGNFSAALRCSLAHAFSFVDHLALIIARGRTRHTRFASNFPGGRIYASPFP